VFRNVVATRPGADHAWIVLGAHYDTKSGIPGFQGANDSGSGVGALLEIARGLAAASNLPASVQLVFFDGEECMVEYGPSDGLHGSRHHAARLVREGVAPKVRGMILLDMVGDRNLSVTLALNNSMPLVSAVLTAAHAENAREKFALQPMNILDDHVPFLEAGMPAVDIIDFQFGDTPGGNEHWHTDADTIDKLDADSLRIVGRVAIRVVNELLAGAAAP
jgi:glutaminyl-peptide cyclotransferase